MDDGLSEKRGTVEEVWDEAHEWNSIIDETSGRDQLTKLLNRKGFLLAAGEMLEHAKRSGEPVSILMMDVDRFKRINDSHGHPVGDEALKLLAQFIRGSSHAQREETNDSGMRKEDIPARWGGEEFIVMLPNTDLETAAHVAERLRIFTEENSQFTVKRPNRFTLSIGVAQVTSEGLKAAITRADQALYQAKQNGRNRVTAAE